jgi:hypothetical protein
VEESGIPGHETPSWTPWLFLTEDYAEAIAKHLPEHFATEGHLSPKAKPTGPAQ